MVHIGTALSQMRSGHRSQLAGVTVGASGDHLAYRGMYTLATLRRFDSKLMPPA